VLVTISCAVLIGIIKLLSIFGITPIESGFAMLIVAVIFSIDRVVASQDAIAAQVDLKLRAILQHLDSDEDGL
jgi:hypothetical protein